MGKLKGFSFVEMLVVIGVIGILLPSIFGIFFSILQQQLKILSLTEVKKQGDYALTFMKNNIQNIAQSVYDDGNEICNQVNTPLSVHHFEDKNSNQFSFALEGVNQGLPNAYNKLVYYSSSISDLTNSRVNITSFTINCSRSSIYSTPIITVSFTIQYNTSSSNPEDTSSMNYRTNIKMKNFK